MVAMLAIKKIGVYLFFVMQIFNAITRCILDDLENNMIHIILSLLFCGFISILLCLKKEGKSAWALLFKKEKPSSDKNTYDEK